MANSQLRGKLFEIPGKVLSVLNVTLKKLADKRESKGYNRLLFLLQKRACTYEQLKRIKNYFDSITPENYDEVEYLLNGGEIMKKWVDFTLDQARKSVHGSKSARKNAGMENQFRADSEETLQAVTPTLKATPEFMSASDLMEEELNKIKALNKKLL